MAPSLGGKPGPYNSLAIASSGVPKIAYYDAQATGSAKFTSNLTTGVSVDGTNKTWKYVSLALDASNNPHVSYYDAGSKWLRYNSASGSTWGIAQVVDNGGGTDDVGQYSSIALDASGLAHISYYDATRHVLMYLSILAQPHGPPRRSRTTAPAAPSTWGNTPLSHWTYQVLRTSATTTTPRTP